MDEARVHWTVFEDDRPRAYEEYLAPALFGPFAEQLVGAAALRAGERVLDVACGTGVVARLAARRVGAGGRVVGIDLNPGMLAAAERKLAGPGAPIEWLAGNAEAIPLPDGGFDVVFCQQGLQFFSDKDKALREMHRLLHQGGRLLVSVWRPLEYSPSFAVLAEALGRHISVEAGQALTRGPYSLTDAAELAALIAASGFRDVVVYPIERLVRFPSTDQFVRQYVAATPLAAVVDQADDEQRAGLLAEVRRQLEPYTHADGLTFPMETNVAIALRG